MLTFLPWVLPGLVPLLTLAPLWPYSFPPHPHLEPPGQELIFHLQKVPLIGFGFKGLIDNGKLGVVLDVLPPCIAMAADEGKGTIKEFNRMGLPVNTSF